MLRLSIFICISTFIVMDSQSQNLVETANKFISTLDSNQKLKAVYPFDTDERFNFHYFPKEDRKGIPLEQLSASQQQAAFDLLKASMSEDGVKKAKGVIGLEGILRDVEGRPANDQYRDPGKYYIIVFGVPSNHTIWGWRLEGHHLSFSFSANENKLVSATPGFVGANPAIVQEGPNKGKQLLKEETETAFALLHSLSKEQLTEAVINNRAPADIITFVQRDAMIETHSGLSYGSMNDQQKQQFLQLINVYIRRYTKLFADDMLKEIQQAGLDKLKFAWAGDTQQGIGHPHYYRIHGPTIIIEYDNTQNRANHIHTVVRDLKNDFGGDVLLEHYRKNH